MSSPRLSRRRAAGAAGGSLVCLLLLAGGSLAAFLLLDGASVVAPAASAERAALTVRVRVLDPCTLPVPERRGARPACPPDDAAVSGKPSAAPAARPSQPLASQ